MIGKLDQEASIDMTNKFMKSSLVEKLILVVILMTIAISITAACLLYLGFKKHEANNPNKSIDATLNRVIGGEVFNGRLEVNDYEYSRFKDEAYGEMTINRQLYKEWNKHPNGMVFHGVISKNQHQTGAAYSETIDRRITDSKWIDLDNGSRIHAYGPARAKIGDKVTVFVSGTHHTFELDN